MWNHIKSARLSLWCTRVLMVCLVVLIPTAPFVLGWYIELTNKTASLYPVLLTLFYVCLLPAFWALFCLDRLLQNIRKDQIFISFNVTLLRMLSWCCLAVVLITCAAGFWYLPVLLITVASGFMGLILRVLKNVMEAATLLKQENELTI